MAEGLVGVAFLSEAGVDLSEEKPEAVFLASLCAPCGLGEIFRGLLVVVGVEQVVGLGEVVELAQGACGELGGLHEAEYVLGLVAPVHGAVAACLPEARLGDGPGEPLEMLGDVEEGGGGAEEVAVVKLRLAHGEPGVVEEGVELLAGPEVLLLLCALLLGGLLLDGVELDGLLHLLDGACEVAGGLWHQRVVLGLGGMHEQLAAVVVLIPLLHGAERLLVVLGAVEVDVIARGECLPVAGDGSVFLGAASAEQEKAGYEEARKLEPPECVRDIHHLIRNV